MFAQAIKNTYNVLTIKHVYMECSKLMARTRRASRNSNNKLHLSLIKYKVSVEQHGLLRKKEKSERNRVRSLALTIIDTYIVLPFNFTVPNPASYAKLRFAYSWNIIFIQFCTRYLHVQVCRSIAICILSSEFFNINFSIYLALVPSTIHR